MNGKAAPILLVVAALAIAAAVLLTTRTPVPTVPEGQTPAGMAGAVPAPGAEASPAVSEAQPARPVSPVAAAGSPVMAPATAPALAASAPGKPTAAAAPETRPSQSGKETEADRSGNIQAEMAVAQALSAAGLSTADIKIATLGSAPAATANESASEAEATSEAAAAAEAVRPTRDLVVPVPTGAKVPVVFYDNEPRPLPQQQALDRIATEFSDTVNNPPAGYSQQEVWEAARKIADERYTVLYGFDAFNQISMQAAKEALKEKKAASAQAATP